MTESLEKIESRVQFLERDMTEVKVGQAKMYEVLQSTNRIHEKLEDTLGKLNTTVGSMEKAMLTMQYEIKNNTDSIQKINSELENSKEKQSKKIDELDEKVDCVDDKGKVDLIKMVRDNIREIIVGVLLLYIALNQAGIIK